MVKKQTKKDPFDDFGDTKDLKVVLSREDIKKFEKEELLTYLCRVGDADFIAHVGYLRSLLHDGIKSTVTKRSPIILATQSTVNDILGLLKGIPNVSKMKLEDAKSAIKEYWDGCEKDLLRIAKNNVVGKLCNVGLNEFLVDKRVISLNKNGGMQVRTDSLLLMKELQMKLSAYDSLCSKRSYARQQDLLSVSGGVAKQMKI